MNDKVKEALEKGKSFFTSKSITQKLIGIGLTVFGLSLFVVLIMWLNEPVKSVLYSKLEAADAATVVEHLKGEKVDYELTEGGTTILVPADKVYELRLAVASSGGLTGQGVGFEIFDEIKIGQTEFIQQINYQRALQGELERTISQFPEIERARIHLVIPQKSLFLEEDIPPSGAVVIQLRPGKELSKSQIEGVVNLVAMSVEGLSKNYITVTDMEGNSLYIPEEEGNTIGLSSKQLEYKTSIERGLERKILTLLGPAVGAGKLIARVNANMDFSQKTIRRELFDPESSVVRSEGRTEESTRGAANIDNGVPEENFRGDGFQGTQTTQDSNRETRTTNYEINREEQNIVAEVGTVERITVAVILDGTYVENPETGVKEYVPRTEAELEQFRLLVENAVGIDTARGDNIELSSLSFGVQEIEVETNIFYMLLSYAQHIGKPFLNAILVLIFILVILRPIIMSMLRPRVAEAETDEVPGLPQGNRLALDDISGLDEKVGLELDHLREQALSLTELHMDQAVRLLKGWVKLDTIAAA